MHNAARLFVANFGIDQNNNGVLDPNEIDSSSNFYLIPQLHVQYTAFIMQEWVDNPLGDNTQPRIFQGDNRTDASGRAIFNRNSQAYRARESFTMIPTQVHDADGLKDGSFVPSVGTTVEYNKGDSLDANGHLTVAALIDNVLNDNTLKTRRDTG